MADGRIVIVGGGAAGIFAAITCAESSPGAQIIVLEKGPQFLSKVRISGGGRCNVTHACFDPRKLADFYPRGGQALIGPFHRFQPRDTQAWFERRGVGLKIEGDGRMFPLTDSSQTIIDCLLSSAKKARVQLVANQGALEVTRDARGSFLLKLQDGQGLRCDRLMLATGGCRTPSAGQLPVSVGHGLVAPVPSLFAFHLDAPWLTALAGVSCSKVLVSVPGTNLAESGPLLITHNGLSGPAILRVSAWGARELHRRDYRFTVKINWAPRLSSPQIANELDKLRTRYPARQIVNTSLPSLPSRLWEALVLHTGIPRERRWAELSNASREALIRQFTASELPVIGKSLNKEEFVTCGGIPLKEVDFKTMQSRVCPGLYFGGELLDIDGITGGFNFQAAWTTGWIAGKAMAEN